MQVNKKCKVPLLMLSGVGTLIPRIYREDGRYLKENKYGNIKKHSVCLVQMLELITNCFDNKFI